MEGQIPAHIQPRGLETSSSALVAASRPRRRGVTRPSYTLGTTPAKAAAIHGTFHALVECQPANAPTKDWGTLCPGALALVLFPAVSLWRCPRPSSDDFQLHASDRHSRQPLAQGSWQWYRSRWHSKLRVSELSMANRRLSPDFLLAHMLIEEHYSSPEFPRVCVSLVVGHRLPNIAQSRTELVLYPTFQRPVSTPDGFLCRVPLVASCSPRQILVSPFGFLHRLIIERCWASHTFLGPVPRKGMPYKTSFDFIRRTSFSPSTLRTDTSDFSWSIRAGKTWLTQLSTLVGQHDWLRLIADKTSSYLPRPQ